MSDQTNTLPVPAAEADMTAFTDYTPEQIELVKRTVCQKATDDELKLFLTVCRATQLNPFMRQIYAVKRWSRQAQAEVMQIQTGIDGYRLVAERTGKYLGQTEPLWCGEDGVWKDVWLSKDPPAAAKVGVYKAGFAKPFIGVARFDEYAQTAEKNGRQFYTGMWGKMPSNQLAKCAEALAIRKAFPQETSSVYTREEMEQAEEQERDYPASGDDQRRHDYWVRPKDDPAEPAQASTGGNVMAGPAVIVCKGDQLPPLPEKEEPAQAAAATPTPVGPPPPPAPPAPPPPQAFYLSQNGKPLDSPGGLIPTLDAAHRMAKQLAAKTKAKVEISNRDGLVVGAVEPDLPPAPEAHMAAPATQPAPITPEPQGYKAKLTYLKGTILANPKAKGETGSAVAMAITRFLVNWFEVKRASELPTNDAAYEDALAELYQLAEADVNVLLSEPAEAAKRARSMRLGWGPMFKKFGWGPDTARLALRVAQLLSHQPSDFQSWVEATSLDFMREVDAAAIFRLFLATPSNRSHAAQLLLLCRDHRLEADRVLRQMQENKLLMPLSQADEKQVAAAIQWAVQNTQESLRPRRNTKKSDPNDDTADFGQPSDPPDEGDTLFGI